MKWRFRSFWHLLRCYSCLLHPQQGSYDIWVHLVEDRDSTHPARFATFLISFNSHLQPVGLCSPLHLVLCTLNVWASIPVSLPVSFLLPVYILLPRPRTTFILSQLLGTVQILVSRQIQQGVGFGSCRWAAASLQFTTVGTRLKMMIMMFKPLTISNSHSQPMQLGN